jgi:hypothetical protein
MKQFLAILSATGETYQVTACDLEDVYRIFGKEILKMEGDFDFGNVDIDVFELKMPRRRCVRKLDLDA